MGGDIISPPRFSPEDDSCSEQDVSQCSIQMRSLIQDNLRMKIEGGTVNTEDGWVFGELNVVEPQFSSTTSLDFEINQMTRKIVYNEILKSYDGLRIRAEHVNQAKSKVLSYVPGAWFSKVGGRKLSDCDVPSITTLILIGPKGSGKSSLVNRISKVFEEDRFASERAQVSYNSSAGDGTYFLQEFMIPKDSMSFCLYDTRGLCDDSCDNLEVLTQWMTKGVCHGELVLRKSDSSSLKLRMKCKVRGNGCQSSEIRMVNFVIFVVNGLSVLKSMGSGDDAEKGYTQTIGAAFNCPYLSFQDDKPAVVVTHGDLLSIHERARVRVHLGDLLGVPPSNQIFDISESSDIVTELTILDMLRYCLEHSDKNLPLKSSGMKKNRLAGLSKLAHMIIVIGIAIICMYYMYFSSPLKLQAKPLVVQEEPEIVWSEIRHLWLQE